jgi:hypothetical protein
MTIAIVAGPVANKAGNGGIAWVPYAYVNGLRCLGFDAFLVEELDPSTCTDPRGAPAAFRDSRNLAFAAQTARQLGQSDHAAVVCGDDVWGMEPGRLDDVAAEADLLINISGHLTGRLRDLPRRKVYVDLDPGFTQLWHAQGLSGPRLAGHDVYFTVGSNVGHRECSIPSSDIRWIPTLPPTILTEWPVVDLPADGRFTTVASWRGPYGRVTDGGRTYGLKAHEFRRFVDLPQRAPATFEIALDIHPDDDRDRESLARHGWRVTDPSVTVPGPLEFRRYVQSSLAEFSVAQGVYVDTSSGWFSDRTARYLASGRPAVVQDTGLAQTLPVGEGLLTFRTPYEAVARIREVREDHERHAKAARAIAEEHLDSDVVLGRMLEAAGVAP